MISRRSAHALAVALSEWFSHRTRSYPIDKWSVRSQELYDFLFVNDYAAWFCNSVRTFSRPQQLRDWTMRLHTGETIAQVTPDWTWEQRQKLGQELLEELISDLLANCESSEDIVRRFSGSKVPVLRQSIELDGYTVQSGELRRPDSDVLDVDAETSVLRGLFTDLRLDDADTVFHHLMLSEEHYVAERWDDAISNARKFFEGILRSAARQHASIGTASATAASNLDSPVSVRDFLEREGLLDKKEKDAVAKVYGLLSHTGGHPYMAERDQARLLRQLALTLSQFVLLRVRGFARQE